MMATTSSIWPAIRARSGRRRAGCTQGARSSPWLTLRKTPGVRPRARRRSRSPIAIEVVRRIDALFEIERRVNGQKRGSGGDHANRS